LLVRRRFKTKGEKRWLDFCFICRTMFMIIDCGIVAMTSKIGQILLGFFPETIRKFFRS
jgi:hypothetical protein